APLAINITKLPETHVSYLMIVAGLGMFVGNFLGARMLEHFKPVKSVVISMRSKVVVLGATALLASHTTILYVLALIVGVITFSLPAPIQTAIIKAAKGAEKLGSSMNQSAFNMGNASGAYLGGIPMVFGLGVQYASVVGALLALCGALIGMAILQLQKAGTK